MTCRWQKKRLGEVLSLEYGKPLGEADRKPDGPYPVYGANGEKARTDKFYFDRPSIIVGRKGSAGEVNLTEEKFWPLDVTYFVKFDEQQHDLRFLYHLLTTIDLPRLAKGVKPGINRNEAYSQVVGIPTLPEQQRIVGILDEAFEGIAIVKANAERNLRNAWTVFDSEVNALVQGPPPNGWPLTQLQDLTTGISDGVHQKPNYVPEGIPFITVKNLTSSDGISFDDVKFISRADHEEFCKRTHPEKGDILITKDGTIGVVRLVETDLEFSIFVSVALVKPSIKGMDRYLAYALAASCVQHQIEHKGTALKHLYLTDLRKLFIPVPPANEQSRIVAKLNELKSELRRLEGIYQQKVSNLDALKKSLLHHAFTGQLTSRAA